MYKSIIELLQLLSSQQKKELLVLQIFVILMAFAEIVGVASIGPFMALVGNMDVLQGDNFLARIYQQSAIATPQNFIILAGLASLTALAVAALISIFTLWRLSIFGSKVGIELGDRLFTYYMHQPWLFHAGSSSASLNKKIASDTSAITSYLIQPILSMNARVVLAVFIILPIVYMSPSVALIGLFIFASAYFLIYSAVKRQLDQNGTSLSDSQTRRYTLMSEGFGGIKDVLLLGRQSSFVRQFKEAGAKLYYAQGTNQTIIQSPRYLMEVVALGAIIFLVIYLVKTNEGNLSKVLPMLAVYAVAGFKLLPAFQNIYNSIATIKAGLASFYAVKEDLYNSMSIDQPKVNTSTVDKGIVLRDFIELNDIQFYYPGKPIPALDGLQIKIPAKKVIGIVGSTGSGKSTLIDIILGLIHPDKGKMLVDGVEINELNKSAWQRTVGFVPQSIYLANSSIIENIGFGLPVEEINIEKVKSAIKLAHLDDLVAQLPKGLDTVVGERGVQLSGGQRQRLGIARALYQEADILILDEATSALDGITEKAIMDAIHDFSGKKTIIMIAHRFATIQKCDVIFMLEHGKVVDQGTYTELIERNNTFKKMALHA